MVLYRNILLIFIILFFQQKAFCEIDIEADHLILQDHYSGEILFEKDADRKIFPASMTKIMTSIIAFDLLKKGDLNLEDKFFSSLLAEI